MSKIRSSERRLTLYKKYIHKDSLRYLRESNKYWKKKSDSLTKVLDGKAKSINQKQQKLIARLNKKMNRLQTSVVSRVRKDSTEFVPDSTRSRSRNRVDSLSSSALASLSKDSSNLVRDKLKGLPIKPDTPSLKGVADPGQLSLDLRGKAGDALQNQEIVKEGNQLKGEAGRYKNNIKDYQNYGNVSTDSLGHLATLRAKEEAESKLMTLNEMKDYQREIKEFREMQQLQLDYKAKADQFQTGFSDKEVLKHKAEEAAMEYVGKNPEILNGVQGSMDKLLAKYSSVPNSNDLSTAVKRTSLEGKAFRERLVIATNFQVLNISPFSIDFSPQVGYKINSRFVLGVGGMYRQTFKDSMVTLAPQVFGYKFFTTYDIIKSFFVYGEYASNSPGLKSAEGQSERIWKRAAWAGVGKRFGVLKKIDMTVIAMYNVLHEKGDPVFPQPFVVRVGFQLSETALFKKKLPTPKW